jgi:4-amino-4-deoxy-L-arabinose transferase-like glycosyltransferase
MLRLRRIFAVVAFVLVVAPLAANAPLFDPDEGLHAAIAQEMVRRGDYVTPTFLGEPFLDKPILFFWAEAASLRLLGDREAAVRLPPLLFGLLGMLAVAALGRAMFDEATGLVAGIVYGTMLLPLGVSEVAVHDVAVVPFMCAACAALFRLKAGTTERGPEAGPVVSAFRRNSLSPAILAGVALGLSILTKGLVGVAFIGLLGICLAVHDRRAIVRIALFLTIAGVVALLVALPWYFAMERAHPGYLHYYFVERHLQGYLTATQRHAGRGWWYYLPIVIGGTLPWTGYLAAAAREARASRMRILVWAWFALGFVFLSAAESKLITYALPLFPALAIVAGERIASRGSFSACVPYGVLAGTSVLLPIGGLGLIALKFGHVSTQLWLVTAIVTVAIAAAAVHIGLQRPSSLEDGAAGVLRLPIMALFGLMILTPRAAAWMTGRDLAAALNATGTLPPHVSVLDERIGSLVFYLSPALRAAATPERIDEATFAQAVLRIRVAPDAAVLAVRDDQVERFSRLFPAPPPPETHAGTFTVFRAGVLRAALGDR